MNAELINETKTIKKVVEEQVTETTGITLDLSKEEAAALFCFVATINGDQSRDMIEKAIEKSSLGQRIANELRKKVKTQSSYLNFFSEAQALPFKIYDALMPFIQKITE